MFKRSTAGVLCTLVCLLAAITAPAANAQAPSQTIYDNQLENGWQSWSWAATNFANTSPVPTGFSDSIAVTAGPWQALWLHSSADFDSSPYSSITFDISGGQTGGQIVRVQATLGGVAQSQAYALAALPGGNGWESVTIPLSSVNAADAPNFDGFWIQNATGTTQQPFYVGNVVLESDSVPMPTTVAVDAGANQHPISPYIYGVAYGTAQQLADLNTPIDRFGGNATSQYNWQLNAANRGSDWFFESIGDSPATPGGDGDAYVSMSKSAGAQPMITIPTIGWVAKLGANGSKLASFSVAKYGAQQSTDPYWSDAGNGVLSSGADVVNDPNDANQPAGTSFEQGWVQHLISTWGNSANGGVRYYIMDNEPSLWQSTHRDVHPVGAKMAEVLQDIESYGSMIKSLDPGAQIVGPEEWGWSGYFFSGYDQQYGNTHGWGGPLPDQTANGGMYYLPWLLQQLQAYQNQTGVRALDYFTVHFYPQGGETGGDSTSLDLLRNRSTRQLWDPNYKSESWIGGTSQNNGVVDLIPLLKSWVAQYYPGTKVGITEYNWGDEDAMNGATTQADILGIFGVQGLDLANRWGVPDPAGPTYQALKMYRNYDGAKSTFGDLSVSDTVPNPDNLSSFAAVRSSDGALTIMVDNKWLSGANTPVTIDLSNFAAGGPAQVYQLAAPGTSITHLPSVPVTANTISFSAPAQSVTLFVVPPAAQSGPTLSSISPTSARAGGAQFTLTATGTGFVNGSTIDWNGTALATTLVSATSLTATVPAADIASAGSATVTVVTPAPGGGTSSGATFAIDNAAPTLSSISPSTTSAGGQPFGLLLTGTGFTAASTVLWNGQAMAANHVSSTELKVTIPSADTATPGNNTVAVSNGTGSVSNGMTLSVTTGATITSLTPAAHYVLGGNSTSATLVLSAPAPAGGLLVSLQSSNSAVATVPASVTVSAGATATAFKIATVAVSAPVEAYITASANGSAVTSGVIVYAPVLHGFTVSPSTIVGGNSAIGTVTLSTPARVPLTVTLASTLPAASVPATVTIPVGSASATFTVQTRVVPANRTVGIRASLNGFTRNVPVIVTP